MGGDNRASHPRGLSGIRVYSDARDRWVRSRTIWNQHAYAVTHVNEDGTVPKTSDWAKNWERPGLNNFRQNVPGTADGKLTADLTAGASETFVCGGTKATLSAPICNRGADAIGDGVKVAFYDGAELICSAQTTTALQPGECETVSCTWDTPPTTQGGSKDVRVVVDDDGHLTECHEGNNEGVVYGVLRSSEVNTVTTDVALTLAGSSPTAEPEAQRTYRGSVAAAGSYVDRATLLRRVFAVDALACAKCGGMLRFVATIIEQPAITKGVRFAYRLFGPRTTGSQPRCRREAWVPLRSKMERECPCPREDVRSPHTNQAGTREQRGLQYGNPLRRAMLDPGALVTPKV